MSKAGEEGKVIELETKLERRLVRRMENIEVQRMYIWWG